MDLINESVEHVRLKSMIVIVLWQIRGHHLHRMLRSDAHSEQTSTYDGRSVPCAACKHLLRIRGLQLHPQPGEASSDEF